jgi:hypothetical protein
MPTDDVVACDVCGDMLRLDQGPDQCWWIAAEEIRKDVGGRYIEGWAVRELKSGRRVPYEHGWVELPDGTIHDPTPHHHCVAYCGGISFHFADPEREQHERGIVLPFYRTLTRAPTPDEPNPKYDPALAATYEAARLRAVACCERTNE